jgi:hypothetical protein
MLVSDCCTPIFPAVHQPYGHLVFHHDCHSHVLRRLLYAFPRLLARRVGMWLSLVLSK